MQRTKAFKRFQAARKKIIWTDYALRRDAAVAAARALVPRRRALIPSGEFKAIDVSPSLACDSGTAVQLLNGCARGDDINERVGRQITMKSIQIKFNTKVTTSTGVDQRHRIVIVYDKQTNAAAAAWTDVFVSADTMALRNLENRSRFVILYDKMITLNASAESGSSALRSIYLRCNLPVTFNSGDAGTVADIVTGSLYLMVIGSEGAGATAGSMYGRSRIRYVDY